MGKGCIAIWGAAADILEQSPCLDNYYDTVDQDQRFNCACGFGEKRAFSLLERGGGRVAEGAAVRFEVVQERLAD